MKTLQVGEFKSHFSEVIEKIKKGEEVVLSYGKKKEKIAVLAPYGKYMKKNKCKIGLLESKATYKLAPDFKMTDEDFLEL